MVKLWWKWLFELVWMKENVLSSLGDYSKVLGLYLQICNISKFTIRLFRLYNSDGVSYKWGGQKCVFITK